MVPSVGSVSMTFTRGAALLCVGALLVAWLAAAAGTRLTEGQPASEMTVAVEITHEPLIADVGAQAERLREHLSAAILPRQPSRNPFEFTSRPATPADLGLPAVAVPESVPTITPVAMSLAGIAERQTPNGLDRTAVISAMGRLFLVKPGDQVTPRFRVVTIHADAVELEDLEAETTLRLRLQ